MGGLGSLGAIGGGIGAGGAATGAGVGAGLSAGAGLTTAGVTPITVLAPQSLTALQAAGALAPGLGVPGAAAALGGGPSTAAPGASSGMGGGQTPGPGVVGPGGEIVVTGGAGNTVGLTAGQIAALTGGLGLTSAAGLGSGSASNPSSAADSTKPPKSTIDKIIDYTRLAGLGTSLIGSMFGGGGGGRTPFMGTGNRNPVFSAKLPAPSLPGGVSSMSARQMPEQNWYEYGFNPEQSFFNTSAPGYTPEPGKAPGMARGGDFAVNGPGDGRSDSIPARLSDGEYVIDAETVALLGNGSPKAGAERLDDFRVSIRKHKGRNLARGKFSVKAKKPEAYLAGGRT
jgi:hypothetical protein